MFAANLLKAFEQRQRGFCSACGASGFEDGALYPGKRIFRCDRNAFVPGKDVAFRSRQAFGSPGGVRQPVRRAVEQRSDAHDGHGRGAAHRAWTPGDNRFKDPEWDHNPFFDFCKQAYLLACKWAEDQLATTPGLDERRAASRRILFEAADKRLLAVEFPGDEPGSFARDARVECREPSEGREPTRRRYEAIRRSDEDQPDRSQTRSSSAAISRRRPARSSFRTSFCSLSNTTRRRRKSANGRSS